LRRGSIGYDIYANKKRHKDMQEAQQKEEKKRKKLERDMMQPGNVP
jgi:predicted DNA-binding transcriptional regulator